MLLQDQQKYVNNHQVPSQAVSSHDSKAISNARSCSDPQFRISLNWPLQAQPTPGFGRAPFHHHIFHKAPRTVNDDTWTFNTQSSSQWDGLRHYAYQKEQRFYNNVSIDHIHHPSPSDGKPKDVNGIHQWAARGIVGRGVLLDFGRWRETQLAAGNDPGGRLAAMSAFRKSEITLADLRAVAGAQGTAFHPADILIIRTGYIAAYTAALSADPEGLEAHVKQVPPSCIGIERSEPMLRFIWENFAAIAGDQPALEALPTNEGEGMVVHEVLLAGWGCPIGELWDLEKLGEECRRVGRWSFLLVSEPTMVVGGVASPPNALAIF